VFQEVEAPRFPDSRHMKVVKLSALCMYNIKMYAKDTLIDCEGDLNCANPG
jgi:hypothetical protein